MLIEYSHLIVLDEEGFYRLLKRDSKGVFSEFVTKIKADNKADAKTIFIEWDLM